jgi:hypothetical protein
MNIRYKFVILTGVQTFCLIGIRLTMNWLYRDFLKIITNCKLIGFWDNFTRKGTSRRVML